MNEFVLVEFFVRSHDKLELLNKLNNVKYDFEILSIETEWVENDYSSTVSDWYRISGRINSMCASVMKLQDPFLSERMRISYISDELKNKYRK